jgi:uncharacterized Zn-binding protein involved in type VI secretion
MAMKYAGRLRDIAHCDHGGTSGAMRGSANVLINNRSALRIGDRGHPTSCCNEMWRGTDGAPAVSINGRAAHRSTDGTLHSGASGQLCSGSSNVLIGDYNKGKRQHSTAIRFVLLDERGQPMASLTTRITYPDGRTISKATDRDGRIELRDGPSGIYLMETDDILFVVKQREALEV